VAPSALRFTVVETVGGTTWVSPASVRWIFPHTGTDSRSSLMLHLSFLWRGDVVSSLKRQPRACGTPLLRCCSIRGRPALSRDCSPSITMILSLLRFASSPDSESSSLEDSPRRVYSCLSSSAGRLDRIIVNHSIRSSSYAQHSLRNFVL